jgi:hypothetical protein
VLDALAGPSHVAAGGLLGPATLFMLFFVLTTRDGHGCHLADC